MYGLVTPHVTCPHSGEQAGWVGRASLGDKRILKPTIPGSQGQEPSTQIHSILSKFH